MCAVFVGTFYTRNISGATSLALHFGTTLASAILSPAYLQFMSVKTGLLIGDFGAFIYCLSNFYPGMNNIALSLQIFHCTAHITACILKDQILT